MTKMKTIDIDEDDGIDKDDGSVLEKKEDNSCFHHLFQWLYCKKRRQQLP